MDLNQLLYRRLSQDNLLNGTLSKYADKPAIFNTEFPPDQQEGWNGKSQYPRISYVFNKQVDTKRSSSGQLTVAVYDIMDNNQRSYMKGVSNGRKRYQEDTGCDTNSTAVR